jgi:hypothetical protein
LGIADARYRAGRLRIYPGNIERLIQAHVRLPSRAALSALGRRLWRGHGEPLAAAWRAAGRRGYARLTPLVRLALRAGAKLAGSVRTP